MAGPVPPPAGSSVAGVNAPLATKDDAAPKDQPRMTARTLPSVPESCEAALAHAADAECEAALAEQDRDAADTRIKAALDRAARERAAAEPPAEDDFDDSASTSPATPTHAPNLIRDALLHHEAAAIINLHAHAVDVQNIRV